MQLESSTLLCVIERTTSEGVATMWPRRPQDRHAQTSDVWSAKGAPVREATQHDDLRLARTLQDHR
jgi:hypothetical protein